MKWSNWISLSLSSGSNGTRSSLLCLSKWEAAESTPAIGPLYFTPAVYAGCATCHCACVYESDN